eukprot:GHVU01089422.1.p2 GENE.GHVU01089422.1~~GHVU01089422.1.p2  ORF type:complete len:111 (-),score=13.07 GHVU01089422.1:35-367(-)
MSLRLFILITDESSASDDADTRLGHIHYCSRLLPATIAPPAPAYPITPPPALAPPHPHAPPHAPSSLAPPADVHDQRRMRIWTHRRTHTKSTSVCACNSWCVHICNMLCN